jgi:hypothetical protein
MDVRQKQRALIECLLFEGRPGDEIAQRLHDVYGQDAHCRASVFQWIQEVRRSNEELRNEGRPGSGCRHEVDATIRSIPQDEPSTSLRTIAETLAISRETVRPHMARIGYTVKASRWIPHTLTTELKRTRVTMCLHPFPKLGIHAHNNWHDLVTGDESQSWFS